jgi:hypothetical protein
MCPTELDISLTTLESPRPDTTRFDVSAGGAFQNGGARNRRWGRQATDEYCVKIRPSSLVTAAPVNGRPHARRDWFSNYSVFEDLRQVILVVLGGSPRSVERNWFSQ